MGPLDYILNWIFILFMQKMWFSMSCFATPKLSKIGFKRTWGPKMLGNDICDLDWWFYVIWNRFLALNRQIFHLRSWKVLRTIINRMSLLPTFSPIKSMNITKSIYTFRTLTETAKQPRDAKIYFPQTLSRKVVSVSPIAEASGSCRV